MKKTLLSTLIIFGLSSGLAQSDMIAVSGSSQTKIEFNDIRFLNLNQNNHQTILNKSMETPDQVVGMSYDAKNNNVLYIGMYTPDIYSYNLKTKESVRIYSTGKGYSNCAVNEQFSRMATSSNGKTYALNNASTQLLEITPTSNGYAVKELGALNASVKLNNYSFYGGDLIADDMGNLYLISAKAQVVKITPENMKAELVGKITNLDAKYTTNGAAVTAQGDVLLSNAIGKGFYLMDFNTLSAVKYKDDSHTPIYDLASPYLLKSVDATMVSNSIINVFPTKITDRTINIKLNENLKDENQIIIHDIAGNRVLQTSLDIKDKSEIKSIPLNKLNPGNYIIKIINSQGEEILNDKFILLR